MGRPEGVAVTGVARTPWSPARADRTTAGLAIEAAVAAMRDAGLTKDQVDGVLIAEPPGWDNPRAHIELSEHLGIYAKRLCMSATVGPASAGYCVEVGRWAIREGRCRHVLTVGAGKTGGTDVAGLASPDRVRGYYADCELPFGPTPAAFHAMLARRHMDEFGTTREELAAVAVAARAHAARDPEAPAGEPLTVAAVIESEPVADPLRRLDCAPAGDGAAAWVLSAAGAAGEMRKPPVRVLGCGAASSSLLPGRLADGDGTHDLVRTVGREAARAAFDEAALAPAEIDVLGLSDASTIEMLLALEDYGFCEKGEGGALVAGGDLAPGGRLPTNTAGGLLAGGGFGVGAFPHYVEVVRQLRGEAGARQVEGAALGLAAGVAGAASVHNVTIFGRE
ncbi:MAG: thiolase family protein [Solirubrobacterales bacterium]